MSFNLAIVEGRLGKDVESRATANGKKVVNFSVGSDYGYGDNKGTQWDTIVCWGAQADFAEKFLKRGSGVLIVGERRTRSWEDKQSGEKKYVTEIHADKISFSGSKPDSPENGRTPTTTTRSAAAAPTRAQAARAVRKAVEDDPFGDGTGITDSDVPF
jgi:single-strand DNA-binding protein